MFLSEVYISVGQNHIFTLFQYPTIGQPKMEVVAQYIIFNETSTNRAGVAEPHLTSSNQAGVAEPPLN